MQIVLQQIEHKATKEGKPFVRAQAKPGGWVSIWAPDLIALVKEHGSGPYEAEVKEDGDFKNLVTMSYTPSTPSAESGHAPGPFRDPIQIIRTDALRLAQDVLSWSSHKVTMGTILELAQVYTQFILDGSMENKIQMVLLEPIDQVSSMPAEEEKLPREATQPSQERPRFARPSLGRVPQTVTMIPDQFPSPAPVPLDATPLSASPTAVLLARAFAAYERMGVSERERAASLAERTKGKGFSKIDPDAQLALVEALENEAAMLPPKQED